jgi:hypothetical protein
MSLQYRLRDDSEGIRWRYRIHRGDKLLLDALDAWCRSNAEFPIGDVVAEILYLFSPRCDPFALPAYHLREHLGKLVGTPEEEYRQTWPRREESWGLSLIAALREILEAAVKSWIEHDNWNPPSGELAECLAEELIAQQYVINTWGI